MNNFEVPEIGDWYRRLDRAQPFRVVACDESGGTVDIEYFDGTLDEWPLSHWDELPIERCAAPEDWTGPFDSIEEEDGPEPLQDPEVRVDWQQLGTEPEPIDELEPIRPDVAPAP